MGRPAIAIPEKLFFKIGEVCELAGVQAHVLRYWESEFPMLAPQKNRAGQRVYRKRDVEIALRIKELLYEDQYTIAGAKKRLANDLRAGGKFRVVSSDDVGDIREEAVSRTALSLGEPLVEPLGEPLDEPFGEPRIFPADSSLRSRTAADRQALRQVASELREILSLLEGTSQNSDS
jgi:DNA-binding transcriptional MerR regulator